MIIINCCKLLFNKLFIIYSSKENIPLISQSIERNKKDKGFDIDDENLKREYEFLEKYIDNDKEHKNNLCEENKKKNRYKDIRPYKYNRIKLDNIKDPNDNYINASPIHIIEHNFFITTQGPKKETINDFWTMIIEQNCNVILMLCREYEEKKVKCADYWNVKEIRIYEKGQEKVKKVEIINENKQAIKDCIIREIKITNMETKEEENNILQINYEGWPDKGVPSIENGEVFNTFEKIIEEIDKKRKEIDKKRKDWPIVVHCSAGVGRTGTFISMYYLEKEIKDQINQNKDKIEFNIFNLVRKIKEMRMHLVQVYEQYKFIYEFVKYLLNKYN